MGAGEAPGAPGERGHAGRHVSMPMSLGARGAMRKEIPMNLATAVALVCIIFLGLGTTLNPDLVATRFPVATGYGTAHAPVILILVLFAAGSWFLFLLITSVSQGILLRKIEQLSAALADKEREVLRVKAGFFDESVETLQAVAGRLDRRLRELEPVLAGRRGEPVAPAGGLESRAA
jgi:hypothetical protein